MGVLYRYEDTQYAPPADECGEFVGSGTLKVELREYDVIRYTPCGAWIRRGSIDTPRFINFRARKQFACGTVEEAKESFLARKKAQIRIHQAKVVRAQRAINILVHGHDMFISTVQEEPA